MAGKDKKEKTVNTISEWESKYLPSSKLKSLKAKLESDPAILGSILAEESIRKSCDQKM